MPHPTPPQEQPHARLEFSEYELQVLETITQHAIDSAAIRSDLIGVVADVFSKIKKGRTDLAITRRRMAVAKQQHDRAADEREDGGDDE